MSYSIDHLYIHLKKNISKIFSHHIDKLACLSCSQLLKLPLITHLPEEKVLFFQIQMLFGTLIKKDNFSAFKTQRGNEHKFSDSSEDKIQYKMKT